MRGKTHFQLYYFDTSHRVFEIKQDHNIHMIQIRLRQCITRCITELPNQVDEQLGLIPGNGHEKQLNLIIKDIGKNLKSSITKDTV